MNDYSTNGNLEENPDPLAAARGCITGLGLSFGGILVILVLALALGGCSTTGPKLTEPGLVTVGVNMPVARGCVPDGLGDPPAFKTWTAKLRNAPDAAARLQLAGAFVLEAVQRMGETEPVIKGCR